MPKATIKANEVGVVLVFDPAPTDNTTPMFGPLMAGLGVSIVGGVMGAASFFAMRATGLNGASPSLILRADDDGVVFNVSPPPPSGPALFGPLAAGDQATLPPGDPTDVTGDVLYLVQVMTTAEAQTRGLL